VQATILPFKFNDHIVKLIKFIFFPFNLHTFVAVKCVII